MLWKVNPFGNIFPIKGSYYESSWVVAMLKHLQMCFTMDAMNTLSEFYFIDIISVASVMIKSVNKCWVSFPKYMKNEI